MDGSAVIVRSGLTPQMERPATQNVKREQANAIRPPCPKIARRRVGVEAFMGAAMITPRLRLFLTALVLLGSLVALSGCANSVVDNCPDVKRDNPSTLQGQNPRGA